MRRDDLRGRQAPRWLQTLLPRLYGCTSFGEPRYRLVWSSSRLERSGGMWTDWDEQAVATRDRGKPGARPLRRVAEVRSVPKYPDESCWLIERWMPAWTYGTPKQWFQPVAAGGTVLPGGIAALGDYPYMGDYEDIGARMYWYPTERHLTTAISLVERGLAATATSPLGRARQRTWRAEQEQERRDADFDRLAADVFDDAAPAFAGAPMVGYGGSHRPALVEMAERIGIRQHPI